MFITKTMQFKAVACPITLWLREEARFIRPKPQPPHMFSTLQTEAVHPSNARHVQNMEATQQGVFLNEVV